MRPYKIVILLWTIIALLAILCLMVPAEGFRMGSYHLRWPVLAQVLGRDTTSITIIDTIPAPIETVSPNSSQTEQTTAPLPQKATIPPTAAAPKKSIPAHTTESAVVPQAKTAPETRMWLAPFYQSLESASNQQIRVVHYGDSQIEEDRITMNIREKLQQLYGGGGVGLIPLHQTIPTRTLNQTLLLNGIKQNLGAGPKRYLAYGPKAMRRDNNMYGVMGQVALMDDNYVEGSENICLQITPFSEKTTHTYTYFSQIRLLANDMQGQVKSSKSNLYELFDSQTPALLPDSTTTCEIRLQGQGDIYGISLETPTGIIVDNIPMRGHSGVIFHRLNPDQLSSFYQSCNVKLIILQYGGNMIPQTTEQSTIKGYVRQLGEQVSLLHQLAPNAAILFIGPSDMATNVNGQFCTNPFVPYMDKLLLEMAQDQHIGYFSLFRAMGGEGSMVEFHDKGLAGSDYVHFTRKGANIIGQKIADWIVEGIHMQKTQP